MMAEPAAGSSPHFLVHAEGDHVGVAVADLDPGPVQGAVLSTDADVAASVVDQVPLGHKFALVDIAAGADVIEYGVRVGVASTEIGRGAYVHTHNVRSARWQTSIAT